MVVGLAPLENGSDRVDFFLTVEEVGLCPASEVDDGRGSENPTPIIHGPRDDPSAAGANPKMCGSTSRRKADINQDATFDLSCQKRSRRVTSFLTIAALLLNGFGHSVSTPSGSYGKRMLTSFCLVRTSLLHIALGGHAWPTP
jgi:hypothetical protein